MKFNREALLEELGKRGLPLTRAREALIGQIVWRANQNDQLERFMWSELSGDSDMEEMIRVSSKLCDDSMAVCDMLTSLYDIETEGD